MESYENNNQDQAQTRAEARQANTESKRVNFSVTPELFGWLAERYQVATERELAEALRLGFYKQASITRPATKEELKLEQKIKKLQEELAAKRAN